jgi:hypothetical protein
MLTKYSGSFITWNSFVGLKNAPNYTHKRNKANTFAISFILALIPITTMEGRAILTALSPTAGDLMKPQLSHLSIEYVSKRKERNKGIISKGTERKRKINKGRHKRCK